MKYVVAVVLYFMLISCILLNTAHSSTKLVKLGEFSNNKQFNHVIKTLIDAKPGDIIIINIDSPGGYVSLMHELITAMNFSQAQVICRIDKGKHAYSAAAMFITMCKNKQVNDSADIMFHMPYTVICSFKCVKQKLPESVRRSDRDFLIQYIYPALTRYEINVLLYRQDKEIYLSGKEFKRRLGIK